MLSINASYLFPDASYFQAKNIYSNRYHPLIWRYANIDGVSYIRIARNGYSEETIPYFPLYPLTIQFVANTFFHHRFFTPISQVISNFAFLGSLFIFAKLLQLDKQKKLFSTLLIILFTFPTSFFLGASYNDSLFLLFATLCIYGMRKNNLIMASCFGALATLTRLNGLALFVMILAEHFAKTNNFLYLSQLLNKKTNIFTMAKKAFSLKLVFKQKMYVTLAIPAAFLAFLTFIQFKFGHWYLLFSTMKIWGQDRIILLPQVFWRYFKIIILYPTFKINYWVAVIEIFFVFFYIAILIYSVKKIRFSYWIFLFISFLIPSLTGTFQGMPRYALHLYPFFLAVAILLSESKKNIRIIYLTVLVYLLFVLLLLYVNGYFVA